MIVLAFCDSSLPETGKTARLNPACSFYIWGAVSQILARRSLIYAVTKPVIDCLAGIILLVLVMPWLVPCVWLGMRFTGDAGPIFYTETRLGFLQKPFTIYKFRTMRHGMTGPSWTSHGDARVTLVGRWLRKSRLDEVPQCLNVLRGEMSLVGPRPLNTRDCLRMDSLPGSQARYLVKPGMTGLASLARTGLAGDGIYQILQRILAHDLHYVQSRSLLLDLRIIAMSPLVMAQARGRA